MLTSVKYRFSRINLEMNFVYKIRSCFWERRIRSKNSYVRSYLDTPVFQHLANRTTPFFIEKHYHKAQLCLSLKNNLVKMRAKIFVNFFAGPQRRKKFTASQKSFNLPNLNRATFFTKAIVAQVHKSPKTKIAFCNKTYS